MQTSCAGNTVVDIAEEDRDSEGVPCDAHTLAKQLVMTELYLLIEHYRLVKKAWVEDDANSCCHNFPMKAANRDCGCEMDEVGEDKRAERWEDVDLGMASAVHRVVDTTELWENKVGDRHTVRIRGRGCGSCCRTLDSPKRIQKIPVGR